jgi:hypothetical protein
LRIWSRQSVVLATLVAVSGALAGTAQATAVSDVEAPVAIHSPRGLATASASSRAYVACGRSANARPASRCQVGDKVGAFFESGEADTTYTVCVRFPTGRDLCATEQRALAGTLYVNNVTTNIPGRHSVTWSFGEEVLERQFDLERQEMAPPPKPDRQETRTCGLLPGDGAYSYIKTRGVSCRAGQRVASRARKKFCSRHNRCLILPPTPITTVYKGRVSYRGWICRVKDGWELTAVRCRKRDMRLFQASGA